MRSNLSFFSNEVFSDPYVLAVPKNLNLSSIKNINELDKKETTSQEMS